MTDNDDLRERADRLTIEMREAARRATVSLLGYRSWDDATDYRLTGEQARQVELTYRALFGFGQATLEALDIEALQQRVERLEVALREARHFTATLAMYDGSAPLEDRFVSLPAIVARRAKSSLIEIDAVLGDDVG